MRIIIPVTTEAVDVLISFNRNTYTTPGYLYIIGALKDEKVSLQRPAIEYPDHHNDAHWISVTENNTTWHLTSINSAQLIKGDITLRISKPASPDNAFGIAYS